MTPSHSFPSRLARDLDRTFVLSDKHEQERSVENYGSSRVPRSSQLTHGVSLMDAIATFLTALIDRWRDPSDPQATTFPEKDRAGMVRWLKVFTHHAGTEEGWRTTAKGLHHFSDEFVRLGFPHLASIVLYKFLDWLGPRYIEAGEKTYDIINRGVVDIFVLRDLQTRFALAELCREHAYQTPFRDDAPIYVMTGSVPSPDQSDRQVVVRVKGEIVFSMTSGTPLMMTASESLLCTVAPDLNNPGTSIFIMASNEPFVTETTTYSGGTACTTRDTAIAF